MINRLVDLSSGSIVFDGTEVSSLRGAALRTWQRDCAMIFQQFNLVPRLDVLTNVLLGRLSQTSTLKSFFKIFSDTDRAQAIELLQWMNMLPQALQRADEIKHPVARERDVEALDALLAGLQDEKKRIVALQPISRGEAATRLCIETCIARNWRLSMQTHKYLNIA